MKTDTSNRLLEHLKINGPSGPSQLASLLNISPQMVHRHIKSLLHKNKIFKEGASPKVVYGIKESQDQ